METFCLINWQPVQDKGLKDLALTDESYWVLYFLQGGTIDLSEFENINWICHNNLWNLGVIQTTLILEPINIHFPIVPPNNICEWVLQGDKKIHENAKIRCLIILLLNFWI